MDAKRILKYLRQLAKNNNRTWFQEHRQEYVRSPEFLKYFGNPAPTSFPSPTDVSSWDQPQGFGLERLKTCPSGFPRDWEYVEYLRMKDY